MHLNSQCGTVPLLSFIYYWVLTSFFSWLCFRYRATQYSISVVLDTSTQCHCQDNFWHFWAQSRNKLVALPAHSPEITVQLEHSQKKFDTKFEIRERMFGPHFFPNFGLHAVIFTAISSNRSCVLLVRHCTILSNRSDLLVPDCLPCLPSAPRCVLLVLLDISELLMYGVQAIFLCD
jgi:hypothetical protein